MKLSLRTRIILLVIAFAICFALPGRRSGTGCRSRSLAGFISHTLRK